MKAGLLEALRIPVQAPLFLSATRSSLWSPTPEGLIVALIINRHMFTNNYLKKTFSWCWHWSCQPHIKLVTKENWNYAAVIWGKKGIQKLTSMSIQINGLLGGEAWFWSWFWLESEFSKIISWLGGEIKSHGPSKADIWRVPAALIISQHVPWSTDMVYLEQKSYGFKCCLPPATVSLLIFCIYFLDAASQGTE